MKIKQDDKIVEIDGEEYIIQKLKENPGLTKKEAFTELDKVLSGQSNLSSFGKSIKDEIIVPEEQEN